MLMPKNMILILLSLLLIFVVAGCGNDNSSSSSDTPPETKDLKATVSQNDAYGTITVTNTDTFSYQHLTVHLNEPTGITLDEGYFISPADLPAGQTETYNVSDFAKSDGTRFQLSQTKINRISVETKDDKGYLTGNADYIGK